MKRSVIRYVIDGKKVILLREEGDEKVEACTFEPYEVYSIDIAMSSGNDRDPGVCILLIVLLLVGEGRPRQTDHRSTVFKRQVDRKYGLKV
jgi:hypothetical protein